MKPVTLLLSVACLLSPLSAQWLEKTIYLPDSFGGMKAPQCLVYDSASNTIYVGADSAGGLIALGACRRTGLSCVGYGV